MGIGREGGSSNPAYRYTKPDLAAIEQFENGRSAEAQTLGAYGMGARNRAEIAELTELPAINIRPVSQFLTPLKRALDEPVSNKSGLLKAVEKEVLYLSDILKPYLTPDTIGATSIFDRRSALSEVQNKVLISYLYNPDLTHEPLVKPFGIGNTDADAFVKSIRRALRVQNDEQLLLVALAAIVGEVDLTRTIEETGYQGEKILKRLMKLDHKLDEDMDQIRDSEPQPSDRTQQEIQERTLSLSDIFAHTVIPSPDDYSENRLAFEMLNLGGTAAFARREGINSEQAQVTYHFLGAAKNRQLLLEEMKKSDSDIHKDAASLFDDSEKIFRQSMDARLRVYLVSGADNTIDFEVKHLIQNIAIQRGLLRTEKYKKLKKIQKVEKNTLLELVNQPISASFVRRFFPESFAILHHSLLNELPE